MKLNYNVVASGSAGNFVRIENIAIDCGIAFNKLKGELYNVDYLLITHIHSDHVKEIALKQIKRNFPRIKVIGNQQVHLKFGVDIVAEDYEPITFNDVVITPFPAPHDINIQCTGYVIQMNDLDIIYTTDLYTIDYVPEGIQFDYVFIESNYDADLIEQIRLEGSAKKKFGYNIYESSYRHLSKQQAKAFFYIRRKSVDSKLIELHKSERFY